MNTDNQLVKIDSQFPDLVSIQQAKHKRALAYLVTGRTPREVVKQRPGRGIAKVDYVPAWWFTDQLNALFGYSWDLQALEHGIDLESSQIWVKVRLTARTGLTAVIKEAYGSSEIKRYSFDIHKKDRAGRDLPEVIHKKDSIIDLADDLKAATTDGMKKAASLLGLAADVYGRREEVE